MAESAVPCETFEELLKKQAELFPDRTALRFDPEDPTEAMTYRELLEAVQQRRSELEQAGRQVVCLTGKSDINWILTMLGSAVGGHMTVLSDPSADPEACRKEWENAENTYPGCLLFYTSGTTAKGKAVVLSQRALLRSAWNGNCMLPCHPEDRLLSVLPLSHVFGFVCAFLWPLSQGAEIDLGTGLRGLMTDPGKYKPTLISLVPSLLGLLLKTDALNPELRTVLVGAGPCQKKLIRAVLAKGIHLRFGYGLTETASGVAISMEDSDPYALVSCPDTKARLSPEGELLLRTACMMEGYYNRPEDTEARLRDGEFHTGDLAEIDADGRIHILGRLNDILVMPNGEKIYCPEIEELLTRRIPEAKELAFFLNDGKLKLAVHSDEMNRNAIEKAVDDYNREQPLGRKIQEIALTTEDFPRTITGKLQRYKLEESFGKKHNRK